MRVSAGCTLACADDLARVIEREGPRSVAAFIAEPVSIFGAVKVPHADYWRRIREICDTYGVLLIADEVVDKLRPHGAAVRKLALGHRARPGHDGEGPDERVRADGAVAVGPRVQEVLGGTPLMHINTCTSLHRRHVPAALAALAITQKEGLVANAAALGPVALSALDAIAAGSAHATRTSGLGLLAGIEVAVDEPRADLALEIRHALYAQGVAVRGGVADGIAAVLFYPPLTVDADTVRSGIAAIGEGLREVGVL